MPISCERCGEVTATWRGAVMVTKGEWPLGLDRPPDDSSQPGRTVRDYNAETVRMCPHLEATLNKAGRRGTAVRLT